MHYVIILVRLTCGSRETRITIIEIVSCGGATEILLINHVYFIINPLCHPWTATSFHLVYTATLHGCIGRTVITKGVRARTSVSPTPPPVGYNVIRSIAY